MNVAKGTYYMCDPQSCDVIGFQNYNVWAVLLNIQAQHRLLAYLHMLAAQLSAIQFEVTHYKIQNDLIIQQHTTGFVETRTNVFISW